MKNRKVAVFVERLDRGIKFSSGIVHDGDLRCSSDRVCHGDHLMAFSKNDATSGLRSKARTLRR